MKSTIIAIALFTSTLILTGCCNTGCDSGWSSMLTATPYTYANPSCGGSTCCGSGSW